MRMIQLADEHNMDFSPPFQILQSIFNFSPKLISNHIYRSLNNHWNRQRAKIRQYRSRGL